MAARKPGKSEPDQPRTLLEAIRFFGDPDVAFRFMVTMRWPDGQPVCPRCEGQKVSFIKTRRLWTCLGCRKQFSIKVGTIFEDSPIALTKWLPAMWMVANCKNGISSYELARALGVTQKTAWFMLQRIRLAMQTKTFTKIGGRIEVDETFIGGRARFMHKDRRERMMRGRTAGAVGKVAVMGLLDRHGLDGASQVRTELVDTRRRHSLQNVVKKHVLMDGESTIYSDNLLSYRGLDDYYTHQVIDHSESYAKGQVHTNGLENFWSLLKRAIKGTYVSVEPFHLFRYLDEQAYKFNNRLISDAERFIELARSVVNRRLTYAELTAADTTPA